MKEYSNHLEFYQKYYYSAFSELIKENKWGDKEVAESYLDRYWLSHKEYERVWKQIQNKIFVGGRNFPEMIFKPEYEMIALRGGCLFVQEDFMQLQSLMKQIGENYFVVIQNSQKFTDGEPSFRMKFPVNLSWNELISGNYISAILLEMDYNEYFIFGESGAWGRYAATDYKHPLDIVGFKHDYSPVIIENFKLTMEEMEEINEWLPVEYKNLVQNNILIS
jgi:hypothetical protein